MEDLAARQVRPSANRSRTRALVRSEGAQSLIEVAVMMPLFILLFCYAIDFGYFFIVASSLTSSARNRWRIRPGTFLGRQGPSSSRRHGGCQLGRIPCPGRHLRLLQRFRVDLRLRLLRLSRPQCGHVSQVPELRRSTLNYTADADPESAMFQLNRVDVVYTITPPIPLGFMPAGVAPTSMNFHRMAEMREID